LAGGFVGDCEAGKARALRGAFAIRPSARVDNLQILLLDDVRTTGAT